ncbi:MAG: phosphoribosyl-AMP cyclohydrolase [Gammaproteobacteria bacterium]|nr:phosphoribosyl-AMP cyclohydrolase [Gammaproteobacteria bacterium]MCW8911448.1 phosphoribosyl-AMP cyclohydrolase [Gammaproteobacteria bacterium]MCW9004674.1 phosphoribosyl-AMP cyclohydrolase [Gammaproteobacteria bacterium]
MTDWLDEIKWTDDGLLPVIAQDDETGRVLMFAWMNRESLAMSVEKGEAVYYSRSRQKLWHKGEESGHTQKIKSMRLDCDADVMLISIEQTGGIACHTGRESCFYKEFANGQWHDVDAVIKDPKDIYE